MDGLAKSYASKSVMFLEYDVKSPHAVHRIDRFMAAWPYEKLPGDQSPETPYTMVDSGHDISWGERDFMAEFRSMIESELPRPPLLTIQAVREHPDSASIVVKAQVTNISTVTLQTDLNGATLHVMVYEGHRVLKTGRKVHASYVERFDVPLRPGETRSFEFLFDKFRGVNLSVLDAVVMVDYLPDRATARWDMMQAAIAGTGDLPPTPTTEPTATPTTEPTAMPTPEPTAMPTLAPTEVPQQFVIFLPKTVRRYKVSY